MNCREAVSALVASVENGTAMSEEHREHIRECERCRELLDSAKQVQTLLAGNGIEAPPVDATLTAAEEVVLQNRSRRAIKIAAGVLLLLGLGIATLLIRVGEAPPAQALLLAGVGVIMATLVATPFLLLFWLVRGSAGRDKRRLYQRLGPGRMLSGVCLGIAEATGVDVRLLRLAFVALVFADGVGIWIYIILALAMPVHPDDRQYLLRFRLRRWWRRRFAQGV